MYNSDVRNRRAEHVQDTVKSGFSKLENVMSDSVLRFRLMPSKAKVLVFLSAVLSLFLYLYLAKWLFQGDPETNLESLLDTEKCPACYGGSACGLFYFNQIEFSGMSRFRVLDILNGKNVHAGYLKQDHKEIVLKKLATDTELKEMDIQLCKDALRPENCDIARVIQRTNMAIPMMHEPIKPDDLKKTNSFMFKCPSYRLLDLVWSNFKEYKKKDEMFLSDKMQILYSALVNPEVLMLQTFPKSEGWPFPEYIGSCGRVVVVEHAGKPLSEFVSASFHIRAGIAYELMKIAEKLTTMSDFGLYLTDVNGENFAVDHSGRVTVVDLENIVVVDKLAIQAKKPRGWNDPLEAPFSDCDGKNCLIFNTVDMCKHVNSDHNYNAICRNILSHYASEPGMPQGFLHDMPLAAEDYWDLRNLLEECAHPKHKEGRWKVKDKIIHALEALKDEKTEHLDTIRKSRDS
ncbi:deleted in autism protein 1 [Biomphalaria pfeifferi]|uniref:Deleted in autism protein 1 n=1 Tax=Biomphalaria pfeifferi TaxID=112525 RepID=A0AAD8FK41_BIOPF|nr:deleted in autism protein 1 [Biomphalaria pfeifferi]